MDNCYICDKHNGLVKTCGLVYSDDLLYVYHMEPKEDIIYLGYLFIELRRHVQGLEDMNDEECIAVGRMLKRISGTLIDNFDIEHIYSHVIGDNTPHLHIHIIPRYKGDPKEFWGMKADEWEAAPHGDEETVKEFCLKLGRLLTENP